MSSIYLTANKCRVDEILARYVVYLLEGFTIKNIHVSCNTIKGYLKAVNDHYVVNSLPPPFDADSLDSRASRLLAAQRRFQQEPDRREPLHDLVLHKMRQLAEQACPLGFAAAVWDITALGCYGGFRQQEYAMDSPSVIKYYVKPDGTRVTRAFTLRNILFKDKFGVMLQHDRLGDFSQVEQVGTRYEVQKNGMNGQVIWFARDRAYPEFCPVVLAISLFRRAQDLGQTLDLPLCVFRENGAVSYLSGARVTEYYRSVTAMVLPNISREELKLISTHSLRVKACVLLAEAGKSGYYIKLRLRWKSNCYEVYLRNTFSIATQHNTALGSSHSIMRNLAISAINLPDLVNIEGLVVALHEYSLEDDD